MKTTIDNEQSQIPFIKENQAVLNDIFQIVWNYVPPISNTEDYDRGE